MKRTSLLRSVFIGLILLCAADPPTTVAQSDAEMERKVITWVIPFKDGGGSDTWARFNAPFLSRHLPGSPEIVVRNVPGGGSTKGANLYAQSARPNGLTLLGTSASTQFPFLLGDSRVRYDYSQWTVLMVYPTGGVVYASPELGIKNARDLTQLSKQKLTYASQGTTSSDLVALLGLELLGINVRPIFGIRGGGGKRLAFMRGDTTIDFQTSTAYLRDVVPMVKDGRAVPLFSFGVLDANGALIRDPNFPDLPNIAEVYRDVHKRDPGGLAWDSWFAFFTAGFGA
ncbi:MAG: tripartite tricarboxylate transporter substrate-binding protein, partial [Pseudomonadota bacterium]